MTVRKGECGSKCTSLQHFLIALGLWCEALKHIPVFILNCTLH